MLMNMKHECRLVARVSDHMLRLDGGELSVAGGQTYISDPESHHEQYRSAHKPGTNDRLEKEGRRRKRGISVSSTA